MPTSKNTKATEKAAEKAASAIASAVAKTADKTAGKPDTSKAEKRQADIVTVSVAYKAIRDTLGYAVDSLPIKSVAAYGTKPAIRNPRDRSKLSPRMLSTIVVAAYAGNVTVKRSGFTIPRYFTLNKTASVIERGCTGDMLATDTVTQSGTGTETKLALNASAAAAVFDTVGEKQLKACGVKIAA